MPYLIFIILSFLQAWPVAAEDGISKEIADSFKILSEKLFGQETKADPTDIALIIGSFLQWFIAFCGLSFLILMLYAGNKWMGAAGNDEAVETAKKALTRAVIGFIVCVVSFAFIQAIGLLIKSAYFAG